MAFDDAMNIQINLCTEHLAKLASHRVFLLTQSSKPDVPQRIAMLDREIARVSAERVNWEQRMRLPIRLERAFVVRETEIGASAATLGVNRT